MTQAELAVSESFWSTLVTVRANYQALRATEQAEGRTGPTPVRFVRLVPEAALGFDECECIGCADTVAQRTGRGG